LMTGYGDDLEAGQCAMCKGHSVAMKKYTETLF